MAFLFITQTVLFTSILLFVVAFTAFLFFRPIRKINYSFDFPNIIQNTIASFIIIATGVWIWFFLSQPNIVSKTWFFITVFLLLTVYLQFQSRFDTSLENLKESPVFGFMLFIFSIILLMNILKIIIYMGLIIFIIRSVSNEETKLTRYNIPKISMFAILLSIFMILGSLTVYTSIDNAEYFDDLLVYDDGLPFNSKVQGEFLRVVDFDLAQSIMKKSNNLGSNTQISDIHLGKINGSTYWIGAIVFSGNKLIKSDLNHYQAFIAVDFKDPGIEPIIIKQKFNVGPQLAMNKKLSRVVYDYNPNINIGDNIYFTVNDDYNVRLMVPYTIQAGVFLDAPNAGIVTQEIEKVGGVLEYDADGNLFKDYTDLNTLPDYGQVQFYSEKWLEREIGYWGQSIVSMEREFGVLTHFGGIFKSTYLMGIDDDVRVLIDPDTHKDVQYVLLDSTGSDNQILRGAIKANSSGIYFYNWADYGFIDTDSALEHSETALTNYFGNSVHGYSTLLPVLYPIINNPQSLEDYAYVMPLLFRDIRFGGIVITDPSDATGEHSTVNIVNTDEPANISKIVSDAIVDYLSSTVSKSNTTGIFNVTSIDNYVSDGNTIYVMEGNLTIDGISSIEIIVFKQELITNMKQWLNVVSADIGDILNLSLTVIDGVYFATQVTI